LQRWLLAGLWVVCAGLNLQGQALAFRHFDHRDGLPESQVFTLMEDRDGFLWAGSGDSVSRLGSSGFQVFAAAQGLGCRNIRAMLQDRRGSIWVAGAGASEIRGSLIVNYGSDQGLVVDDRIYAMAEDAAGNLFLGTRLGLFQKTSAGFTQVKLPGNWFYSPIFSMVSDTKGGLWLGSRKGLLGHWDGQNFTQLLLPKGFEGQSVRDLHLGKDASLQVLCPKGLLRLDRAGIWATEPMPGLQGTPELRSFEIDAQGGLVVSLGLDGLYVRTPSGQGTHLTYRNGLPRHFLEAAFRDRRGILWAGTNGGGLLALPTPDMRVLAYNAVTGLDLGLGNVLHFLELPGGRMLMGTFGGLVLWQEGKGILQRWDSHQDLPSNEVWTLEADGAGGAWLGTSKGVAHWAGGRILPGPAALKDAAVNQFLHHQGRLWVGTSLGLAELDATGRLVRLDAPPQEVGGTNVSQMLPRPWGLLVGTQLGPYTYRDGQFKKAYPDSPVAKREVTTLTEDAKGQLWLGTLHGLFGLVGPATNRQWKAMEGSLQNGISWVRPLPSGGLGVGHTKGVTFLSAAGDPVQVTRNLGLLSDETNQDGALVDRQGRLWVGMQGGANILAGTASAGAVRLPAPRVLEASWGGVPAWLPEALDLPPNPANVSLTFDVGLPCAAQAPRYQVMIEGLDSAWRAVEGAGTSVQIAQLGPGTYTFRVRATLDGVRWTEGAPCPLHVRRAWYQTYLARGALFVALLSLLGMLVQLRFKRLQHRAALLEQRIQDRTQELALRNQSLERLHHQLKQNMEGRIHFINTVTHDLRSPLTSIMLGVDRLKEMEDPGADPVLGLLDRESRRLEVLLKGLLDQSRAASLEDSLDLRLCHPGEILLGLTETFQLKAQAQDLKPRLDLDPGSGAVWVLADVTAMQQVLFNLIENALKFTPAPGAVGIRSRVLGGNWMLEVWDEGRGIEPTKLDMIFLPFTQSQMSDGRTGWGLGLSICKAIAEAHSGRIEVESEPGRGSLFRVFLPLVLPNHG
jgi:signal transduction histidine kinase/ligand-binding sensor domain-containing protein